jgi:hypothetical protein
MESAVNLFSPTCHAPILGACLEGPSRSPVNAVEESEDTPCHPTAGFRLSD